MSYEVKGSEQQLFDRAVRGLKKQKWRKSINSCESLGDSYCRYRGDDGRRCPVGWLIPDRVYRTDFEGWSVWDLIAQGMLTSADNRALFLAELQVAHDESLERELKKNFRAFARQHDLNTDAMKGPV